MDQDFSVRRLGPSLVLMWVSGATRLIALTKADLVEDASWFLREAAQDFRQTSHYGGSPILIRIAL